MNIIQNKLDLAGATIENLQLGFSKQIVDDTCDILIDIVKSMDVNTLDCLNVYINLQVITTEEHTKILTYTKLDVDAFKLIYKLHIKTFEPNSESIISYLDKIKTTILDLNKDLADNLINNLIELIDILDWLDKLETNILIDTLTDTQKKAREYYNKKFYSNNDSAHKIDHADDVHKSMIVISNKLKLNLDTELMFMIAYIHDIFSSIDRNNHHALAYDYVMDRCDNFISMFEYHEREIIAIAIKEHRASGNCKFSNKYSLALKIADKGKPILDNIVKRSYLFHKQTVSDDVAISNVVNHIKTKYSRLGYAFKCDYYRHYYGNELLKFWDSVDNLTFKKVEKMLFNNNSPNGKYSTGIGYTAETTGKYSTSGLD